MTGNVKTDPFSAALASLLGPLARAMVAKGVTLQAATEALKQALLEAALDADGEGSSDSRISLRTGLHRKDVRRLRTQRQDSLPTRSTNAVAMVLSYWNTAPEYQTAEGHPRDLPREGHPNAPGLYDVIRRTRVDMAPGTVLAAMLEQGVVSETAEGLYHLCTGALLPDANSTALVAAYRATLSAHLDAATHNLIAPPGARRYFDRVVRYSHLSPGSVETLHVMTSAKAQALLEEINATARELQERDDGDDHSGRFAFGAYQMYRQNTEDET